ncbi:MAG: hypothetical protein HQK73_06750 [Desulfamplus sp.]|nr:hypothetical protein [Desulfamplus sp.]
MFFDRVILKEISLKNGEAIPAGAIAITKDSKPLVHRDGNSWVHGNTKGAFITSSVSNDCIDRFELIIKEAQEDLDSKNTFCLYNNLAELEPNNFEKKLNERISHLEMIAATPVIDLKPEEYKMPVGRVKRFSNRALFHLAGHSEDWQNRTFTAVIPSKLYATVQDEKWVTYENRFMVTLCHKIDEYLIRRLSVLNSVKQSFDEMNDFYSKRSEYFARVGEQYDRRISNYFNIKDNDREVSKKLLNSTKELLEKIQNKLRNLWSLQFFKEIKAKPINLGKDIHLTNLLQNHQHYRHLITIREAFLNNSIDAELSSEELEKKQLKLIVNLNDYLHKCISIFLNNAEYNRESKNNTLYTNFKKHQTISVKQLNEYSIELESNYLPRLRFVAISVSPENFYKDKKTDYDGITVIAYPSNSVEIKGVKSFQTAPNALWTIGLSPLSIYSEELIAMVLFRWINIPILKNYPIRFKKIPEHLKSFLLVYYNDAFILRDKELVVKENTQDEIEIIKEKFDQEIKHKLQKDNIADNTWKELEKGLNIAQWIKICPLCNCNVKNNFLLQEDMHSYSGRCKSCGVAWQRDNQNIIWKNADLNIDLKTKFTFKYSGRYSEFKTI